MFYTAWKMCLFTADCMGYADLASGCFAPDPHLGSTLDPAGGLLSPFPLCPPYLQTLATTLVDVRLLLLVLLLG